MAMQMAGRARRKLEEDAELKGMLKPDSVRAKYADYAEKRRFEFDIDVPLYDSDNEELFLDDGKRTAIFKTVLDTAALVLEGYRFEGFDAIMLKDMNMGGSFTITKPELEDFRKKKIEIGDILWRR